MTSIVTLTAEQIKELFKEVLQDFQSLPSAEPDKLLTKQDICERLTIKNNTFPSWVDTLSQYGMFQVGEKGSTYRMRESDFNTFIEARRAQAMK